MLCPVMRYYHSSDPAAPATKCAATSFRPDPISHGILSGYGDLAAEAVGTGIRNRLPVLNL